jgi:probable blue pigment (indigoidine) exporter
VSTSVRSAIRGNPGAAKGFAFLLVTAFGWGLNWPVIKFLLTELPPFSARVAVAVVGTALAFGLATSRRERLAPPAGQWGRLVVSAALNFSSFMISSSLALLWLRASEAVIIAYTLPIWASLLAWPILGEKPTPRRLLALVLGLAGVIVTVSGQPLEASWEKLPGVLCAFAGSVMFALGIVISKRQPLAMPPVAGVAWQVGIGSAPAILPAIFEHPHWSAVTPAGWGCMLYMSTMPIVIAYIAWFRALKLLPASTAAIATLMVPVIGVFSAALLLGEPLGLRELAGLGLTLSGVGLAARR